MKEIEMEPEELLNVLAERVKFPELEAIDTPEERKTAQTAMNIAVGYICYFKEMETRAKILKRKARDRKDAKEASRLLGVEEVFEAFKRIAETRYDYIVKTFTLKRISMQEMEITSHT